MDLASRRPAAGSGHGDGTSCRPRRLIGPAHRSGSSVLEVLPPVDCGLFPLPGRGSAVSRSSIAILGRKPPIISCCSPVGCRRPPVRRSQLQLDTDSRTLSRRGRSLRCRDLPVHRRLLPQLGQIGVRMIKGSRILPDLRRLAAPLARRVPLLARPQPITQRETTGSRRLVTPVRGGVTTNRALITGHRSHGPRLGSIVTRVGQAIAPIRVPGPRHAPIVARNRPGTSWPALRSPIVLAAGRLAAGRLSARVPSPSVWPAAPVWTLDGFSHLVPGSLPGAQLTDHLGIVGDWDHVVAWARRPARASSARKVVLRRWVMVRSVR